MVTINVPLKLPSQHSAENLAGTKSKFKGKSLLYANINKGNVNINKGKELLVGLGIGDMFTDSSAHHCGCVAYAMAAC